MQDQYGRDLRDLRVSVTDRCNLRCVYCVPAGVAEFRQPEGLLRDSELLLLINAAAELGVRKVRLTGGEPTLRPGLVELVRAIRAIGGIEDLAMTTNGLLLDELAHPLAAAGMEPIKVNAVVVRDLSDDVVPLAALTLERPWEVRFIEMMPVGTVASFAETSVVTTRETMARIEAALGPLTPTDLSGRDPATTYRLPNAAGTVGFISPVSQPFCARCGRLRLTADGRLPLCLLRDVEEDLLTPLRNGASYEQIRDLFRAAAFHRPAGHLLAERAYPRTRVMMQIGG